ncbi:c-type cytochrome [Blastopirellula sp. JC732]|uniref:C-type cytochrome n=1 Tax=Blastopirellula sediminis TaxID=2894196 RepID=A0A9X1MLT7_9BACT|nr:PVC-type heme-binding CxxCH protein [Blastopirellula sediminis]MCC9609745.1 c-type cytochrome [Blastopirellula sediminis]MCC9628989.1 c-type cytochrome [Blastopirellula sediminis]
MPFPFRPLLAAILVGSLTSFLLADEPFIPRKQSAIPGPPLSPEEAAAKMTVPPGFTVEVVAAEPDLINPVAMTFDDQGRIWVTESLEYPRHSPGPGRDRVKVLEDTDHDGRVDKTTIFAEGLNIPSGIAVGYGGVWVANSPDLLFLQDTDGDLKADKQEVVVTGFGRSDTHELPNSLTWGPDGALYGLNGVFNPSHVTQNGKTFDFTCAMFRIDPRTREFSLFCEGTSNPWGIAFDPEGSAFVSACVIDHLWHLTETGYYHRQGGPYPPFTWKIESIVQHKHQMAAYCGIEYFDSDAYPAEYRDRLYMGNIHGNCVNVDEVTRDGSTYFGKPHPDFVTANDVWHMPVDQKIGPDGCLYVLDWYDRYHCYQDAMARPAEVDRLKGRLYRIRYKETPRAESFDLANEDDEQLIERLRSGNRFYRDRAQRLLSERNEIAALEELDALALDKSEPRKARLHAVWAIAGTTCPSESFIHALLHDEDSTFRAWGIRIAGNFGKVSPRVAEKIIAAAKDDTPDVQLQAVIAAGKLKEIPTIPTLIAALGNAGDDKLIPHIVWQNLHPLLETDSGELFAQLEDPKLAANPNVAALLPRIIDRILAAPQVETDSIIKLVKLVAETPSLHSALNSSLATLAARVQSGEIDGDRLAAIRSQLEPVLQPILTAGDKHPSYFDAALLAVTWKNADAQTAVRAAYRNASTPDAKRAAALAALVAFGDDQIVPAVRDVLVARENTSKQLQSDSIAALGKLDNQQVAEMLVATYPQLASDLQPKALEVLTQRVAWSQKLLAAVAAERIAKDALNINQVRRLQESPDSDVVADAIKLWGQIRTERNPQRELVIADMRRLVRSRDGDPHAGAVAFQKLCGQCHKIYGQGQEVGPDITTNGRGSFEQLLSSVFDPSLVIGPDYQGRMVLTADGRTLTGLMVEDNDQRVVLKLQGGKLETIPRDDVDAIRVSKLSLMPEGVEKQLSEQELIDLFAYLSLTRPPGDPNTELIPGAEAIDVRRLHLPSSLVNQLASAELSSNATELGKGARGAATDLVYLPEKNAYLHNSQWHEVGVGGGADLGIVSEGKPVFYEATWKAPVAINLITLSGVYPNQPQPNTAWKIEVRSGGDWRLLDRGVGGWYDNGRYVWGAPGTAETSIDGFRVSLFSPDEKTPIRSVHFRGEEGVSWFVGSAPADAIIVKD